MKILPLKTWPFDVDGASSCRPRSVIADLFLNALLCLRVPFDVASHPAPLIVTKGKPFKKRSPRCSPNSGFLYSICCEMAELVDYVRIQRYQFWGKRF